MDWNKDIIRKKALVVDVDNGEERTVEQILRIAIDAENEAVNLYQRISSQVDDKDIKKVFNEIIIDEKRHVSQFMQLLLNIDKEQDKQMDKGIQENKEILS